MLLAPRSKPRAKSSAVELPELSRESWVSQFLRRNSSHLLSRWQLGMDRDRYKADLEAKYSLYFKLLHSKIKEYNVEPSYINMDKKGFIIRVTRRLKRVFDKGIYD